MTALKQFAGRLTPAVLVTLAAAILGVLAAFHVPLSVEANASLIAFTLAASIVLLKYRTIESITALAASGLAVAISLGLHVSAEQKERILILVGAAVSIALGKPAVQAAKAKVQGRLAARYAISEPTRSAGTVTANVLDPRVAIGAVTGVVITVQNLSKTCSDTEAQAIVAALNEQASKDYNPSSWVTDQHSEAAGSIVFVPKGQPLPPNTWHLEILDTSDEPGALGYHEERAFRKHTAAGQPSKASERSERGLRADAPHLPLMKVFAATSKQDGVPLSEVCSHELLEALVDPRPMVTPRTVVNPRQKRVYIVEVGDPVQETAYKASNGQLLANFAEPRWFGLSSASPKTDFRGVLAQRSFAITAGGYMSYALTSSPNNWKQETGPVEGEVLPEEGHSAPTPTPAPSPTPIPGLTAADAKLYTATKAWAAKAHTAKSTKPIAEALREWAKELGLP